MKRAEACKLLEGDPEKVMKRQVTEGFETLKVVAHKRALLEAVGLRLDEMTELLAADAIEDVKRQISQRKATLNT